MEAKELVSNLIITGKDFLGEEFGNCDFIKSYRFGDWENYCNWILNNVKKFLNILLKVLFY